MRLIETLRTSVAEDDSPFRAQVMREDIERINALRHAALELSDATALRRTAMDTAWTTTQARTNELSPQIEALSDAIFALESAGDNGTDAMETAVERSWLALHQQRLERMVGCLSTPLPKPFD